MTAVTPPDRGKEFRGRVALVTGAGSGIGRETCLSFANRDARVVVGDVDVAGGEETVSLIEGRGGKATFVEGDVTDDAAVERMVETAIEVYGGLDFAHNNAGISAELVPTSEYPNDTWRRVIDVNLSGVWRCLKHELSRMDRGSIVNTASVAGEVGLENHSAYVASKHGVLGLTKVAALEYAPEIRVNAVCPGFIETPMTENSRNDPERYESLVSRHAMERFGRPEEVAAAVVWLCSDEASFVTGEGLGVEGGYLSR
jgi:NAD(P)-dependent dehydrogenase (short-subunit alcohol dehydrogenase family)